MIEFQSFGKIGRLNRDIVVTEKIDGTNAAVGIRLHSIDVTNLNEFTLPNDMVDCTLVDLGGREVNQMVNYAVVYAQSRTRVIHPKMDNHGFARWVWENAEALVANLGEGLHFGEWWGSGINRGYGLPKGEKRFSLFNTKRWGDLAFTVPGLEVVPELYRGPFTTDAINACMDELRVNGSHAAPGYDRPEGVVIYHTAANVMFKATLENDEVPKALNRN